MINNDYVTPPDVVAGLRNACRTYGHADRRPDQLVLDEIISRDFITDGDHRSTYKNACSSRASASPRTSREAARRWSSAAGASTTTA